MLDEQTVGRGSDRHGLLHEPVEQLPAMPGGPTIEPERELVEVVVQMGVTDGTLMRPEQPAFEQRHDAVDARQQLRGRFLTAFEERDAVLVAPLLQSVVTEQPVGVQQTAWRDRLQNESFETVGRSIGNSAHADATDPFAVLLGSYRNQGFLLGLSTTNALFESTEVRLVDFHLARQPIASRSHHRAAQLVEPGPGCFVAAQPQDFLQPPSARPRPLTGHPPHRSEPRPQRRPRILENRAGRHGHLSVARGAANQCRPRPQRPALGAATRGTPKSVRPSQSHQVRPARLFRAESRLEFGQCSGIVLHGEAHYRLWLRESRGYPLTSK